MKNTNKATMIGLVAVLLWSSIVGLIRSVSDHLGPTGGAAMMYSVASVFLLLSVGRVKLTAFPRRYLIWGSLLFVTYELCLSLSIGYANTARQALQCKRQRLVLLGKAEAHNARILGVAVKRRYRNGCDLDFAGQPFREVRFRLRRNTVIAHALEISAV